MADLTENQKIENANKQYELVVNQNRSLQRELRHEKILRKKTVQVLNLYLQGGCSDSLLLGLIKECER
ncbi:MAG: hypothetical protein PHV37_09160 [Candidatus Gastranaerophilales bacterium]|nr:hypothetical protein [Candidatus Gastranaerophilales bacterium]